VHRQARPDAKHSAGELPDVDGTRGAELVANTVQVDWVETGDAMKVQNLLNGVNL